MKKALSLALALSMLLALALPALAEDNPYAEPVTFTMNVIYTDRVQEDPRTQFVLDKFNIKIDFVACSSSDFREKSRLWITGDDMPDVMWTAFGITAPEHTEFVQSGLLRPWPSLDNYPNLKAIQESIGSAVTESIKMNGDRYYYFTEGGYMNTNQLRSLGLYYRTDWARKAGLFHEDHTYTWDEVMQMAIAFGNGDFDENGQKDTIGFTAVGGFYPNLFGFFQNAMNPDGFVPQDGAYHWRAGDADVVDALKEFKYLYDQGALYEEQIMASTNDGINKFASGLAGICANNWHMGQVELIVQGLEATYPGQDVLDLVSPMRVINKDGSMSTMLSDGYWGELSLSAHMDEKALARFMDMFEYLASDEGFLLSAIGLKDKDYRYNDQGEIELLWEKDENGAYVNPYQVNAHRFISLPRLYEGWALESPASNEKAKVLGNRLNDWIQACDNLKLQKTDWSLAVLTNETAPLYKGLVLSPTVNEKISELALSTTADKIEEEYLAWIKSVQGQIQPVEEELTKVVFGK